MKVKDVIKEKQPEIYKKLQIQNEEYKQKKEREQSEHLSFSDVEKLMGHSSYRRSKGGALRQVRYK